MNATIPVGNGPELCTVKHDLECDVRPRERRATKGHNFGMSERAPHPHVALEELTGVARRETNRPEQGGSLGGDVDTRNSAGWQLKYARAAGVPDSCFGCEDACAWG